MANLIKKLRLFYATDYTRPLETILSEIGDVYIHISQGTGTIPPSPKTWTVPSQAPQFETYVEEPSSLGTSVFTMSIATLHPRYGSLNFYLPTTPIICDRPSAEARFILYANENMWFYSVAITPTTSSISGSLRSRINGVDGDSSLSCNFVHDTNEGTSATNRQTSFDSLVGNIDENGMITSLYCRVYGTTGSNQGFPTVTVVRTIAPDSTNTMAILNAVESEPETPPDPYDQIDGEADLPGDSSLDIPPEPTTSPVDSGLFSLFAPSSAQMRSLADYLWTDFGGAGATVEQILEEVVEALKRSVSNPLNSIFGLSIIASQGLTIGSSSSVRVGFWDTGISMPRISKQYFTVDCGSLSFDPVCGNTFLDYGPYSKFTIFLPYVGMRALDANDVVGHTISVIYRGDCVSGALVCFIKRDGKIIAEHSGNCALNLPLSADSWASTISSAARIAISGDIAPAMAGLSMGAAGGAVKVAAAVATNPSALSPQVGQSGSVAGSSGHMASQKPFILREAVRFHSTEGFNGIIGYPSYYYRKLGDCRGYTQCLDVHLSHTPATGDELKEIEELLKQGVII